MWDNEFHFSYSAACENAKERFKKEHNIVMAFLNECVDITGVDSKTKVRSSDLFPKFSKFCKDNHYNKQFSGITKARFFKLLEQIIMNEDLDIVKRKQKDAYYFVGMKFKQ